MVMQPLIAATVSVQDTVRPIAICQNITTYLNNAGAKRSHRPRSTTARVMHAA